MPFLPAEAHGKLVIMALLCYAGEVDEGERAIAPFRALAEPIADMVKPMPYPEIYPPEEDDYHPIAVGAHDVHRHHRPRRSGDDRRAPPGLDAHDGAWPRSGCLVGRWPACPSTPPRSPTAAARIMVNVAAFYEGPDEAAVHEAWVTDFAAALRQGDDGAYVGFLGDEGEARVRDAYPGPTWERLAEIKGRYDPTNLFRLNQNIRPSAQPTSDAVSANTATGSRFALTKNRFTPSVDTSEQVADS